LGDEDCGSGRRRHRRHLGIFPGQGRQLAAGLETSFANAGELSYGYSSPWAGPGVPLKAVKWLTMKHSPLIVRPNPDPKMWWWMLQMLRNCTSTRYAINKGRMVRVAEYSRDIIKLVRAETGIEYDGRSQGTLQLFRTQSQVDHTGGDIEVLKDYGVPFEVLDAAGCIAAEPGLKKMTHPIAGGLRLPEDETGDCHMFTQRLAKIAADLGVIFRYGTTITGISKSGDRIDGVETSAGRITGDTYLLALGSFSPLLSRQLDLRLPIYPVKGYSITVPIIDASIAPVSTVMDESYKVAITRLGDRIRVGGTAELSGYNNRLSPARRATLEQSVTDLFPGAGDVPAATFWTGLRPMTPDGTPIIGKSRYGNLFINSGHGTLGWTMACGSGRIIADLIAGKPADIDTSDLGPGRYAA
jgi:D-amino-acid dehydrogenase